MKMDLTLFPIKLKNDSVKENIMVIPNQSSDLAPREAIPFYQNA